MPKMRDLKHDEMSNHYPKEKKKKKYLVHRTVKAGKPHQGITGKNGKQESENKKGF